MTTPTGSIHSPNYPNAYDANDDCAWLIEVDANHVVQFTFVDFDVEPHQSCAYDYVALYDGANTSAPLIIQVKTAVYFDQQLGAAHSKRWSKSNFYLFFAFSCKILMQK